MMVILGISPKKITGGTMEQLGQQIGSGFNSIQIGSNILPFI